MLNKHWKLVTAGYWSRSILTMTLEINSFGNGFKWIIRDEFGPLDEFQWNDTLEGAAAAAETKMKEILNEALAELNNDL